MNKDLIVAVLLTFCFTVTLFTVVPTIGSPDSGDYDPWLDYNDDGEIDMRDVGPVARAYGSSGTPINKTEMLLRMDSEVFQSGLLIHLPFGATWYRHGDADLNNILHWLDLDQNTLGNQTVVFVSEGEEITVTGKFQNWQENGVVGQDFFIYSWTPSWPPPNATYYHPLYDGQPGVYPGVTQTFSFELTVPNEFGVYYLYYCSGSDFSMSSAVNRYTEPLWAPYAVITVCSSP